MLSKGFAIVQNLPSDKLCLRMEIIYEWNLPLDGILTEIDFEPKPESAFGQKIYFGLNLPLDLIGLQLDFKGTQIFSPSLFWQSLSTLGQCRSTQVALWERSAWGK